MTQHLSCIRIVILIAGLLNFASPVAAQEAFQGSSPDIVVREDGRPLISYQQLGGLRLLDCSSPQCTNANDRFLVGSGIGRHRMAIRQDGRPIIAYEVAGGTGAAVYDCADADCSTGTSRSLDPVIKPTDFAIVIRDDGRPLIAYGDSDLSVRQTVIFDCADVNCTSGSSHIPPGQPAETEQYVNMSLRASGDPLITASRVGGLMVYDCDDPACLTGAVSEREALRILGAGMAVRSDDTAVIGYVVISGTGRIKLLPCGDTACGTGAVREIALTSNTSVDPSIVIRPATAPVFDRPFVVYRRNGQDLEAFDCDDADCSTGSERTLGTGTASQAFSDHSLALSTTGTPVIANIFAGTIGVISCEDEGCESFSRRTVFPEGVFSDSFE